MHACHDGRPKSHAVHGHQGPAHGHPPRGGVIGVQCVPAYLPTCMPTCRSTKSWQACWTRTRSRAMTRRTRCARWRTPSAPARRHACLHYALMAVHVVSHAPCTVAAPADLRGYQSLEVPCSSMHASENSQPLNERRCMAAGNYEPCPPQAKALLTRCWLAGRGVRCGSTCVCGRCLVAEQVLRGMVRFHGSAIKDVIARKGAQHWANMLQNEFGGMNEVRRAGRPSLWARLHEGSLLPCLQLPAGRDQP